MARRKLSLYVIQHTRWPLEKRQTFEHNRLRLVATLEHLINILKNDETYPSFLLDGQSVLLEDYLEIRPDQADVINRLIADERIEVGPWYITPELFLVQGEAVIRNLQIGQQIGNRAGRVLNVAYLPESAGAFGQLPQILQQFGIDSAVMRRGMPDTSAELWWEAPDESRVLLINMRDGLDNLSWVDPDSDTLKKALVKARDNLRDYAVTDAILLMHGDTYQIPKATSGELLQDVNRRFRGTYVIPSSLREFIDAVLDANEDLPSIAGELRSPERTALWQGTLSSRIGLKQRNFQCQTNLLKWAEPFSTWVELISSGQTYHGQPLSQDALIQHAWRILLRNHNPGSIRGTSIDQVHREMAARFDNVEQITETVTNDCLEYIASRIVTDQLNIDGPMIPLVVFNGSGHRQPALVQTTVSLPDDYSLFEIVDLEGEHIPHEALVDAEPRLNAQENEENQIHIRFVANEMPAFGYKVYAIRPFQYLDDVGHSDDSEEIIENEFLSVTANSDDGTLTLFDKQTGRSFSGLNHYSDGGDCGDVLNYCKPERDTVIDVATNAPLKIHRHIGPITQTLELLQIYRLPESLTPERDARLPLAAQFVPVSILTTIQITKGIPRVDIEVNISNGAKDHRLRVHFPTGIVSDYAYFEGHFEIVERSIELPSAEDSLKWVEQPTPEHPQQTFVTLIGDDTGLTIANRGLPEVGLHAHPEHGIEVALTLLRSVGWVGLDDLPNRKENNGPPLRTPEAQERGEHVFSYSLIPHDTDPLQAWQQAWAFQTPMRAVITDIHDGDLPLTDELVAVEDGAFKITSVTMSQSHQGMIVRGYNLIHDEIDVTIKLAEQFEQVEFVQLDHTSTGDPIKIGDSGQFTFMLGAGEIVTLLVS